MPFLSPVHEPTTQPAHLDVLCLVQNHVHPLLAAEHGGVREDQVVRRDADVEAVLGAPATPQRVAVRGHR